MQRQLDLFKSVKEAKAPVSFKEALFSGELAGMVNEAVKGEKISSPETLYNVLKPLMSQHSTTEKFYCIFLDSKNKIIEVEAVFSGSISSCAVYPREIIKTCLEKGAAALVVAHNHPSGDKTPSSQDEAITKKIIAACQVMGVIFHDHFILGDGSYHSMSAAGTVQQLKQELNGFFI